MKARQILHDPTHPLNEAFEKLPSGRRLKVPLAKKNLFMKSFIPSAILILNAKFVCTVYFFIPYTYCIDLFNLIYLPILVNIINIIILCLIKEPFMKYYLLIYLFIRVLIYILNLFTLSILVLINIVIILMCLINCIWISNLITGILMCN